MSKVLSSGERINLLRLIAEQTGCTQFHNVILIGVCEECQANTLHCAHREYSGGMSCQDDYIHFCSTCNFSEFASEQQQEDLETGLEAAICPFCNSNWTKLKKEV